MADKITRNLTYGLVTTVVGLEIHQALTREDPMGRLAADVSRWIFDTREDGLRRALIELGWTPPAQDFIPAPRPTRVDPFPRGHQPHCNSIRPESRGGPGDECDCIRSAPAPIVKPDKLEICKHSGSVTYLPMTETYKCDTCGGPLTKAEVQKLPASSSRGFPYG